MLLVDRIFLVKKLKKKLGYNIFNTPDEVWTENLLIMDTKHAQNTCCGVGVNYFRISQPTFYIGMLLHYYVEKKLFYFETMIKWNK